MSGKSRGVSGSGRFATPSEILRLAKRPEPDTPLLFPLIQRFISRTPLCFSMIVGWDRSATQLDSQPPRTTDLPRRTIRPASSVPSPPHPARVPALLVMEERFQ